MTPANQIHYNSAISPRCFHCGCLLSDYNLHFVTWTIYKDRFNQLNKFYKCLAICCPVYLLYVIGLGIHKIVLLIFQLSWGFFVSQ